MHKGLIDEFDGNSSRNKGIDMQSFGAMTGVDQGAVREIEQLIQLQSNTNLNDASTLHKRKEHSSINLASAAVTVDERNLLDSGQDTKKSKVIFSVKKEQLNNN
jgi:hypothetical protein